MNIKRLKEAEEKKKEEEELEAEGEESEEENAFDSLLGVIGEGKTEDNDEDMEEEEEEEEEEAGNDDGEASLNDEDDCLNSNRIPKSNDLAENGDEDDQVDDDNDEEASNKSCVKDSFLLCFQTDLKDDVGKSFKSTPSFTKSSVRCYELGAATAYSNPAFDDHLKDVDALLDGVVHRESEEGKSSSWDRQLKPQLCQRVAELLPKALSNQTDGERDSLTTLQRELLAMCLRFVTCMVNDGHCIH